MSTAAKAQDKTVEATSVPAKPKGMLVKILIACVVVGLAAAGGGYFFSQRSAKNAAEQEAAADTGHESTESAHGTSAGKGQGAAAKPGAAHYQPLSPAFVVNLSEPDSARYLMVDIEVVGRDSAVETLVTEHLPSIRNALLMLLSQQTLASVQSREGKESLRQAALLEIQTVLKRETGKSVVDTALFTSFVVQ